jgi:hypothetical protein
VAKSFTYFQSLQLVLHVRDKRELQSYLEPDYCEVYDYLVNSTDIVTADKVKVTVWPLGPILSTRQMSK